jgi:hypothetical protein
LFLGIYLGMYPHSLDHECDSILMTPELFLSKCQPKMKPPLVYEYKLGEDILWDDTVYFVFFNFLFFPEFFSFPSL